MKPDVAIAAAGPVRRGPAGTGNLRTTPPRPWGRAAAWLAFLAPFFFASYGFANHVAAARGQVPSIVYDWERAIPFLPWTIVPYWSIDLLYGLSLFVCATRRELDTHARRLLTAQGIALFCFIAAPLRYTFARPATDGAYGAMFDLLLGFDLPFNQLPSLHIALAVILWLVYAPRVAGLLRVAVDLWFVLIAASVLTTYQHHFVDLPTGFFLGWLCAWLWPDAPHAPPLSHGRLPRDPARRRLAFAYGAGALACGAVAVWAGGAAGWLLWPAGALALVALAYLGLGAQAFQKGRDGRLSLAVRWLCAPYLAAAWINSRLWTRRRPAPSLVADGVHVGRAPTAADLKAGGFASVVDLAAETSLPRRPRDIGVAIVPLLDLVGPSTPALAAAAHAIERLHARGPVLVVCALGCSRSASAAAAWLLATGRARDVDDALGIVRRARPGAVFTAEHAAALQPLAGTSVPMAEVDAARRDRHAGGRDRPRLRPTTT